MLLFVFILHLSEVFVEHFVQAFLPTTLFLLQLCIVIFFGECVMFRIHCWFMFWQEVDSWILYIFAVQIVSKCCCWTNPSYIALDALVPGLHVRHWKAFGALLASKGPALCPWNVCTVCFSIACKWNKFSFATLLLTPNCYCWYIGILPKELFVLVLVLVFHVVWSTEDWWNLYMKFVNH